MVWVMFVLCGAAAMAAIIQDPAATVQGCSYVAWEAEDANSLTVGNSTKSAWTIAQSSTATKAVPPYVFEDSLNYYGTGYLFASEKSYATDGSNYATYYVTFTVPGSYLLFARLASYDQAASVGGGDSIYLPAEVDGFLPSGASATVNMSGGSSGPYRDDNLGSNLFLYWEWFSINNTHIQVTPEQLAATGEYVFELRVATREGGFAFDRMMAIAAESFDPITSADLDSIVTMYEQPWGENPADGATNVELSPTLSWNGHVDPNFPDLLNSSVKKYYVYMSQTPGGAVSLAGQVVVSGTDPAASFVVGTTLEYDAVYSWQIEEGLDNGLGGVYAAGDPNNVSGPVWSFETITANPTVWAGMNVVAYLENGTAAVNLAAAIEWFNTPSTIEWSVVSMPDGAPEGSIQFSSASIEDPTVTISYAGKPYVLNLRATDVIGNFAEDTMQIDVYADSCIAAQNILHYQPMTGDLDRDCNIDLDDFAAMAANWLEHDFLTAYVLY